MSAAKTMKTLSNGTMALKFMQNAMRAEQMKEVHLEKAEVKDDGEWEVSKAVREAWGLASDTGVASSESRIHEDSYLPFLFSDSPTDDPDCQPRARRVFGKRGEELVKQTVSEEAPPESSSKGSDNNDASANGKGRKVHPRPVTISSTGSRGYLRGFEEPNAIGSGSTHMKSARQMLFETNTVGTDLRSSKQKQQTRDSTSENQTPPPSTTFKPSQNSPVASEPPKGFMKPAGIDEPSARPSVKNSDEKVQGEKKTKRTRRGVSVETDRSKKRKHDRQTLT